MDRESTYLKLSSCWPWLVALQYVYVHVILCLLLIVSVLFQFSGSPRPDGTAAGRAGQDGGAPQDAEAGHVGRESPERVSDRRASNTRGKSTTVSLLAGLVQLVTGNLPPNAVP